jgi:hypothetical protein
MKKSAPRLHLAVPPPPELAALARRRRCTYVPVVAAPRTTALGRFMAHMALMYRGLVFGLTWHAALMVSVTCFCTFLCSEKMFDIKFNTSMQVLKKTTLPNVRSHLLRREGLFFCPARSR